MFSIDDDTVFTDFEEREIKDPSARKEVNGRRIYQTRRLRMPKEMGPPVLCDLGSAVAGDENVLKMFSLTSTAHQR